MSINKNDDNSSEVKKENKYVSIIENKLILNFDSENISKDENTIKSNDSIISKNNNIDDISMNSINEKTENDDIHTNITLLMKYFITFYFLRYKVKNKITDKLIKCFLKINPI